MPTVKELLATGVTEIDMDDPTLTIKGRGGMAPYCQNRQREAALWASLTKISKAEQRELDKRPLTVVPPHPAIAAYAATLPGGSFQARKDLIAYKQKVARDRGFYSGTLITNLELVEAIKMKLAKAPEDPFLLAALAWWTRH